MSYIKDLFEDTFFRFSIGIFVLFYILLFFLKSSDSNYNSLNLLSLLFFCMPYFVSIANAVFAFRYNGLRPITAIFTLLFSLFFLSIFNMIVESAIYFLNHKNMGEFDGIQFIYCQLVTIPLLIIVSIIFGIVYSIDRSKHPKIY